MQARDVREMISFEYGFGEYFRFDEGVRVVCRFECVGGRTANGLSEILGEEFDGILSIGEEILHG